MKTILYLNYNFLEDQIYSLNEYGNNIGNVCFFFGTKTLLDDYNIFLNESDCSPDLLIISTANCISNIPSNIGFIYYISNTLKKFKCKKIILSIGAQNNNLDLFNLNNNAITAINDLFSQTEYVFLRGGYTYNLLKYNNLNYNYIVNGCPSICEVKNLFFKTNIKLCNENRILFNLPRETQKNISFVKNIINYDIDFFLQDSCGFNKKYVDHSYSSWKNLYKKYDFILGTRIHGAIVSLIVNKPTLLIIIDSRTFELANKLKIPCYNNIDDHLKFNDKTDLINFINTNYSINLKEFNRNKNTIISNYKNIIYDTLIS